MNIFEKLAALIGNRQVPIPAIPRFSISMAIGSVAKIVIFTIMVSAAAVAVGMYFAIRDVVGSTYNWPDAAVYQVTEDGLQTMGQKNRKL